MADFEREFLDRLQDIQAKEVQKPPPRVTEDPTVEIETVDGDHQPQPPVREHAEGSGVTAVNIFRHRDAHPYVLDFLLIRKYGPEWMSWEPETLGAHINQDFRGGISDLNFSKVQSMKTLHMVDTFWQQWEVFVWCLMPFNGVLPDFQMMQVPTVAQCLVGIDIANRVREDVPWSDEVKAYLEVVFRHDGLFCPQSPADFVHVDTEGLPIDCEEIHKRWPDVRVSGHAPGGENITDEQLRRLLIANTFLEESRAQLRRQEPLIHHA